jgi:hypothetical protein
MPSKLPTHEWLIIALLIVVLMLLTGLAFFSKKQMMPIPQSEHALTTEIVEVTVQGAVEHIGVFEFRKGAKMKDLWALCKPQVEADLTHFKPNQLLRDGQLIKIPLKEYITIYITGAVQQEGPIQVLKGTPLKDLKHLLSFKTNAETKYLNKTRRLKDQEIIRIREKRQR